MSAKSSPYDEAFFSSIDEGAMQSSAVVLPVLFQLAGRPDSIVDLGCGTGAWLAAARTLGAKHILGVDGAQVPEDQLRLSPSEFRLADLCKPVDLGRRFDVAMSLEVGEHLPPSSAKTLVSSLCAASDLVLFSAALPGQGGVNHLNEQPLSYWADLFSGHGYRAFDLLRPRIWDDRRVMFYYRQNLVIFASPSRARLLESISNPEILDIVHPEQLHYWRNLGPRGALRESIEALRRAAIVRTSRTMRGS